MIGSVSHCPRQLRKELLRTSHPVVFDCETTGLDVRTDRILSLGFRIKNADGVRNFILFSDQSKVLSIRDHQCSWKEIADSIECLSKNDTVLVGHNIKFDLLMLAREGLRYKGPTRDTQAILRLLDQDRGFATDQARGRKDLIAPWGRSKWLNYRLKDVASQICNVKPFYTPPNLAGVGYADHTRYLTYDLFVTDRLHETLWRKMSVEQKDFYQNFSSPLTSLLCDLTEIGVQADLNFMEWQIGTLAHWLEQIADQHVQKFNLSIPSKDDDLRVLLYEKYRLPTDKFKRSVDSATIGKLSRAVDGDRQESLELIAGFRSIQSQKRRIESYVDHVGRDGRIHSSFNETQQTSGRISSSNPNLQQISNTKKILIGTDFEVEVRARNLIKATEGYLLVGADIDQADIRMLAERIVNCKSTTRSHVQQLHLAREAKLHSSIDSLKSVLARCRNDAFPTATPEPPPSFDPNIESQLARDFQNLGGDLYSRIASNILGRDITKADRQRAVFKTVTLAQINGQSVGGLAKDLKRDRKIAKGYVSKLFETYPDIAGFLALLRMELAVTGQLSNWAGRVRTHTAHHWMVSSKRVHILVTYRDGHRYWFDVSPIRPSLRNLTCFIHRIWNVRDPRGPKKDTLIYERSRGRIGTKSYPQIDKPSLYHLPVRNLPWSNIRRVRKLGADSLPTEEVKYEGFDTTARSIINSVMQGGTSDLTTKMALRCQELIQKSRGRLLLMVHDELIWEVPIAQAKVKNGIPQILFDLKEQLELPPCPSFKIPITVGMKYGSRFGEMVEM